MNSKIIIKQIFICKVRLYIKNLLFDIFLKSTTTTFSRDGDGLNIV